MPLVVKNQKVLVMQTAEFVEAIGFRIPKYPAPTTFEYAELGRLGLIGSNLDIRRLQTDFDLLFKLFCMFTNRVPNDSLSYDRLKETVLEPDELEAILNATGELLTSSFGGDLEPEEAPKAGKNTKVPAKKSLQSSNSTSNESKP